MSLLIIHQTISKNNNLKNENNEEKESLDNDSHEQNLDSNNEKKKARIPNGISFTSFKPTKLLNNKKLAFIGVCHHLQEKASRQVDYVIECINGSKFANGKKGHIILIEMDKWFFHYGSAYDTLLNRLVKSKITKNHCFIDNRREVLCGESFKKRNCLSTQNELIRLEQLEENMDFEELEGAYKRILIKIKENLKILEKVLSEKLDWRKFKNYREYNKKRTILKSKLRRNYEAFYQNDGKIIDEYSMLDAGSMVIETDCLIKILQSNESNILTVMGDRHKKEVISMLCILFGSESFVKEKTDTSITCKGFSKKYDIKNFKTYEYCNINSNSTAYELFGIKKETVN